MATLFEILVNGTNGADLSKCDSVPSPKSFRKVPIDPVTEDDDRPSISDLLETHSSQVKDICDILKNNEKFDPTIHDDLWVLRYFLSHKNIKKAAEAAKATLDYREKYRLDELGDIRQRWREESLNDQKQRRNFFTCIEPNSIFNLTPNNNFGAISYYYFHGFDQKKFVKTFDQQTLLYRQILYSEWLYQVNDEVTRRTGRLTKTLKILDLKDMSLRKELNATYLKREGKNDKELQDFYPQALGTLLIINAPSLFQWAWNLFSPLFPKRLVEKVNVVNPQKCDKDLKQILKFVSKEDLPTRWGGDKSEWPPTYGKQ